MWEVNKKVAAEKKEDEKKKADEHRMVEGGGGSLETTRTTHTGTRTPEGERAKTRTNGTEKKKAGHKKAKQQQNDKNEQKTGDDKQKQRTHPITKKGQEGNENADRRELQGEDIAGLQIDDDYWNQHSPDNKTDHPPSDKMEEGGKIAIRPPNRKTRGHTRSSDILRAGKPA